MADSEKPKRPPIASLVDQFTDEFGEIANQIVPEIRANLDLGMNPRAAVGLALAKFHVDQKITDSILDKLVKAAAIGFGVEPAAVVNPVGVRNVFLNNHWQGDNLTLSQRIARADYKQIIIDTMDAQMRKSASWTQTAQALTDKQVIAGSLPGYIDRLEVAARKNFSDQPELKAEFMSAMKDAKRKVARLSQNGAPNQTVKTIYGDIIRATETLDDKALDKALHQAVKDKARYNAERIARTEMARAYGAGVDLKQAQDTDVIAERIMISTRHPHYDICNLFAEANLYGMGPGVYPKDKKPPYPFHPHCILPGQIVHLPGRVVAATKSLYIGPCIEIGLRSGKRFSVTANHPILTARGWVLAKFICKSDQVITAIDPEWIALNINPNDHQRPSRIEDVFGSLMESSQMASASVPCSPEYFHGDGRRMDGDIQVVFSKGFLESHFKSEGGKHSGKIGFRSGAELSAALSLKGALNQKAFRFDAAPAGSLSLGGRGESARVSSGDTLPSGDLNVMKGSFLDSQLSKSGSQDDSIDPNLARQFVLRFAGQVALDNIIEIRNFDFSGHVYDLQVEPYELFICNGTVVKNCLCLKTDIFEGEVELQTEMLPGAMQKHLESLPVEKQQDLLGVAGQEAFAKNPKSWEKHLKNWEGVQPVKIVEGLKPEMFAPQKPAALERP